MSQQMIKAYPEFKQLDKYSAIAARKIYKLRPQWMAGARVASFKDKNYLCIELEAPDHSVGRDMDLLITTHEHCLTVYFDWYHTHFDQFAGSDFDEELAKALAFAEDIIKEQLIVCVRMKAGEWRRSSYVTPEQLDELDSNFWTYTRSWRGTYSRMLE